MSNKTKLTSVNILDEVYTDFKEKTMNCDITLQKIVNRAIDLYIIDGDFKNKIDSHETRGFKNSKF